MTSTNNGGNWDAAPRLINMVGDMKAFQKGHRRTFRKKKPLKKDPHWKLDGATWRYVP